MEIPTSKTRVREAMLEVEGFAWEGDQPPAASNCLARDSEEMFAFFRIDDQSCWNQIRTSNAIEGRLRELRRPTRPMGVFFDSTSMERIPYAAFTYGNTKQGTGTPIPLTQNS